MLLQLAANVVLIVHLAFIVAVVLGGLAWLRWRYAPLLHLPMAAWGIYVEAAAASCPLTVWENRLLQAAGESGYSDSFISHYLLRILYPPGLTADVALVLALGVVVSNLLIYGWVARRRRLRRATEPGKPFRR